MVQKEVAGRIMAKPNTKDYGAYTVKLAALAEVTGSFNVSRQNFLPPPNVESTVIQLVRRGNSENKSGSGGDSDKVAAAPALLGVVADAAFAERRKTIRNSMKSTLSKYGYNPEAVNQLLQQASIDPNRRAESLTLAEFTVLAQALQQIS
jgi:16S rRNA (adenine1518-N6/adenine1519-N6)-dimethyltransferase